MPKFKVNVSRLACGSASITVEAASVNEAKEKALSEAGDYEFKEHESTYAVESVEPA